MNQGLSLKDILDKDWTLAKNTFLKANADSVVNITSFYSGDVYSVDGIMGFLLLKMEGKALRLQEDIHPDFGEMISDEESSREFVKLFNSLIELEFISSID